MHAKSAQILQDLPAPPDLSFSPSLLATVGPCQLLKFLGTRCWALLQLLGLPVFFPSCTGDAHKMLGSHSPYSPTPAVSCFPAVPALLPGRCQASNYTGSCGMLSYAQQAHVSKVWLLPCLILLPLLFCLLCSYKEVRNMTPAYWANRFFPGALGQFL